MSQDQNKNFNKDKEHNQHAERAADHTRDAAKEAKSAASGFAKDAKQNFQDSMGEIKETAHEYCNKMNDYVQHHPARAIGIAAAVGALVALLIRR